MRLSSVSGVVKMAAAMPLLLSIINPLSTGAAAFPLSNGTDIAGHAFTRETGLETSSAVAPVFERDADDSWPSLAKEHRINSHSLGGCEKSYKIVFDQYKIHFLSAKEVTEGGIYWKTLAESCGKTSRFFAGKDEASVYQEEGDPEIFMVTFDLPLGMSGCINKYLKRHGWSFEC